MAREYANEISEGFWATRALKKNAEVVILTKIPENTEGWSVYEESDLGEKLGYRVFVNDNKWKEWGVDMGKVPLALPSLQDAIAICDSHVNKEHMKTEDNLAPLLIASSIAREAILKKEKWSIGVRTLMPKILGGMFVGALMGLIPVKGKLRYVRNLIAMSGALMAYNYSDKLIPWGRNYRVQQTKEFIRGNNLSEAIRVVVSEDTNSF